MVVHVVLYLGAGELQGGSPVMGMRADSLEASVIKMSFAAGDGCGRRHGFMGR